MSFILDALKKSENERQRQLGPSLADIPLRRARSDRPWWAVAVAALLVVNLGVLVVVLLRDREATQPHVQPQVQQPAVQQPIAEPAAPPPSQPSMAAAAPEPTSPAVRSLADEAGFGSEEYPSDAPFEPSVSGAANVPDGPPVVRPVTPPTVAPLPNQATFAARARPESPGDDMLPTHSSLVSGGTSLPDMRLDIHVYSAKPTERFVFVNMHKYVEGQTLSEGPLLERITTDGAILNQNGLRFLLPRQ